LSAVYSNDSVFEMIAGSRAQVMYDNKNSGILYYFDSQDSQSASGLAVVKEAARKVGAKVYGIDVKTSEKLDKLTWIWSHIDRGSASLPVLFLMFRNGGAQVVTSFGSQAEMDRLVDNWNRGYYNTPTPTATPTPERTGSPTPTPTPTGIAFNNVHFSYWSEYNATREFTNGTTFVYLYIDTSKDYDSKQLEYIRDGVIKAGYDIYYSDHREQPQDVYWFANELYVNNPIPNPNLFFVAGGAIVRESRDFYVWDADEVAREITRFFSSYGYY
jgi:hypothetical protein